MRLHSWSSAVVQCLCLKYWQGTKEMKRKQAILPNEQFTVNFAPWHVSVVFLSLWELICHGVTGAKYTSWWNYGLKMTFCVCVYLIWIVVVHILCEDGVFFVHGQKKSLCGHYKKWCMVPSPFILPHTNWLPVIGPQPACSNINQVAVIWGGGVFLVLFFSPWVCQPVPAPPRWFKLNAVLKRSLSLFLSLW